MHYTARLCQHIETSCEVIQQHLNSARRRVPRDQMARPSVGMNLGFDKDWPDQFINCYQNAVKVAKTLQDILKSTLQTIIANGGKYNIFILTFQKKILVKRIVKLALNQFFTLL